MKTLFSTMALFLLTTHAAMANCEMAEIKALEVEWNQPYDDSLYCGVDELVGAAPATELSKEEKATINYYTTDGYQDIDGYLEHGQPSRPMTVTVLDRALNKLPVYQHIVFHVATLNAQQANSLKPGMVLHFPAYMSTSKVPIPFSGNIRFLIHQKDGRDISNYSAFPNEKEVLLPRGVRLRIDAIDDSPLMRVVDRVISPSGLLLVHATEL